jgi:hypothetical protein
LAGKKSQENGTYKKTLKKWRDEGGRSWNFGMRFQEPNNRLERARFKNQIRELVLERDNYKCCRCESKDNLQVDHIQSWSEYVELRFDINNCRTLCMECHYEITYGRAKPKDKLWGHYLLNSFARKE